MRFLKYKEIIKKIKGYQEHKKYFKLQTWKYLKIKKKFSRNRKRNRNKKNQKKNQKKKLGFKQ